MKNPLKSLKLKLIGRSYRFHLSGGSVVTVTGVKSLSIKWGPDHKLTEYNISFLTPRDGNVFYMSVKDIIAIEEVL